MRRSGFVVLVFVAALAADVATAQTAIPNVELGLDASVLLHPDRGGFARGPRLIVNFDGRNALEVTASLQPLSPWGDFGEQETDLYLAAFKRVVHATGPIRVFATLGGGLQRTVLFAPGSTFGSPPVTFPPSTAERWLPALTAGGGVDVRLGRRAAMVVESSFVLTDHLGGRVSGGLVLPIGAYPSPPGRLAASVPWADLSEGSRAWVTGREGREVTGEVVLRSPTRLVIRTSNGTESFALDDVVAIDTTDPIRNGTVLGAKIGAAGAVVQSVLITILLCSFEEECGVGDVLGFSAAFVGLGTGIGAATGALVDSLRERRAQLYRRRGAAGVTLGPLLRKQGLGVGAAIRW